MSRKRSEAQPNLEVLDGVDAAANAAGYAFTEFAANLLEVMLPQLRQMKAMLEVLAANPEFQALAALAEVYAAERDRVQRLEEIADAADLLKRAHFARMSLASIQARAKKRARRR